MKDAKGHGSESHGAHASGVEQVGQPIRYGGREGRRVGGGRYEIAHTYYVGNQEFRHHNQDKALAAAQTFAQGPKS